MKTALQTRDTARLNRYLWLLTGRHDNFVSPALNSPIKYDSVNETPAIREARELLRLHDTSTDYYVRAALVSVYANMSMLRGIASDASPITHHSVLIAPGNRLEGASLALADIKFPSLLHHPQALPASHVWTVEKLDDQTVRISSDAGVAFNAFHTYVNQTVYVTWPEAVGFRGALKLETPIWVTGSSVTIHAYPASYPYRWVADAARNSLALVNLMAEQGTLEAFTSARQPLHQVGALAAAIVIHQYKRTPELLIADER